MTTITNEFGTFTGETERDALKKARAAQRRERRLEKKRAAARKVAADRARANAFRVHDMLAEIRAGIRKALPRAWRLRSPGELGLQIRSARSVYAPGDILNCWSEHVSGPVPIEFVTHRVEAVLQNAVGVNLLVFLREVISESLKGYKPREPRRSCAAIGAARVKRSDLDVSAIVPVCLTVEEVRDNLAGVR